MARPFLVSCVAALAALFSFVGGCAAGSPASAGARDAGETAVRAAYDIGSATTKVKVARVDPRRGRIVEDLFSEEAPVDYQASLERAEGDGSFAKAVMDRGVAVLERFRAAAERHGATRHRAVATAAFRRANNAAAFVERLERATGIRVAIVSPRREAILGFRGAVARSKHAPDRCAVWDAGGGSMQFAVRGPDGFRIHVSEHGSVPFRNRVIERVQGRSAERTSSPNPLTGRQIEEALALAKRLAGEIPAPVARRFRRAETTVLGIGGVHYYSVRGQLGGGKDAYTRRAVAERLKERAGATDAEIGGEYASTEVTNLILILGYMRRLGIERVEAEHVTLSDGLLVAPGR